MAVAILQARMSSSRLPGKVMKPLAGRPMVERQIERLRRCETLTRLVVATSKDASDDVLASLRLSIGVEVYRGPLADPGVIDDCVRLQAKLGVDYCSNGRNRTYPRGLDVESFDAEDLLTAGREATDPYDREHVTPFLYRSGAPFTQGELVQARDESALRWTVDTPEDYAFVEKVYAALYPTKPDFTSDDIRALPFSHFESDT